MAGSCTVCDLDQRPRRIGEAMLKESIGVRDVADFINWWLERDAADGITPKKVTKSALDRHKNSGHFAVTVEKVTVASGKYATVEDIADEMVRRYGTKLEDGEWMPTDREAREWAALVAKVDDLSQRRRDEQKLMGLMLGASFKRAEALPAPIESLETPVHVQ